MAGPDLSIPPEKISEGKQGGRPSHRRATRQSTQASIGLWALKNGWRAQIWRVHFLTLKTTLAPSHGAPMWPIYGRITTYSLLIYTIRTLARKRAEKRAENIIFKLWFSAPRYHSIVSMNTSIMSQGCLLDTLTIITGDIGSLGINEAMEGLQNASVGWETVSYKFLSLF